MKKTLSLIVGAGCLLLSQFVHANSGWTDVVAVAELVPTAKHYYVVRLPVKQNPSGCENKTWFYQNYGSFGSDKMFQTLLEGVKTGIRLRVYVTGICNIEGYSEFSSVSVVP
ncbi:MAG: hypothetical protein JJE42_06065 [Burkholderiales bacterium]|nr:hypothetical protein [Burkholderiales bacterium]